ncbi:hypothetical protein AAEX28_15975 [Lentisphaerota bacterium WC36G]|nr:hypothetical protein LJT99_02735 [Lentisphaerae bacterium WC36]
MKNTLIKRFIIICFFCVILLLSLCFWVLERNPILLERGVIIKNKNLVNAFKKTCPNFLGKKVNLIKIGSSFRREYHVFYTATKTNELKKKIRYNIKNNLIFQFNDCFFLTKMKDYFLSLKTNIPNFVETLKDYNLFYLENEHGEGILICFFKKDTKKVIYYFYFRPDYENLNNNSY